MPKWKCEPCGHETKEKPGEVCFICSSPVSSVKLVKKEGEGDDRKGKKPRISIDATLIQSKS